MGKIDKYLPGWQDEYYRVMLHCREAKPNFWIVRGQVMRLDSNEEVGGVQRLGDLRERELNHLAEDLEVYIGSLPRPPTNWGRKDLRMLLVDYKIFREELTRVLVKLQDLRLAKNLSEFDLRQSYWKSMDFVILNTINLSQRLYLLREDDRIDLMIASDEAYKNQTNPWNLDDLEARSELFKFIANPSDEVVKAHELHEIRRING